MGKEILYPIDTANFEKIREKGFIYVDKTRYIHNLTKHEGTYYFLARPRRFGKSLFLDTLAEFFKGNRELFRGLAIDKLKPEEWETYPVLRFNLTGKDFAEPESLKNHLSDQLQALEEEFGLEHSTKDFEGVFDHLIRRITKKTGKKVVILIDEYDAPLSSNIDRPELQEIYRSQLHGFYSILKSAEAHIRFCFLTGVTRYGKVSVFSGLNNLRDITFHNDYAGICGITLEELRQYYHEGVKRLADNKNISIDEGYELLKFHYDGYHFSPSMLDIYNPYSLNYALTDLMLKDYWCRSGVPTVLSKSLLHNDFDVSRLNGIKVEESELSDLSMYALNPIPLFYQTGYLTLKAFDERRQRYTLGYPNREVEWSILNNVLSIYLPSANDKKGFIYDMEDALEAGCPEQFVKLMKAFLADIPNQLHQYVAKYENYYHTIFYCLIRLIGLNVQAEYSTSEGFIDMLVKTADYIYIIELKINGTSEEAMRQIEERHYADPFVSDPRRLIKIGLGFSAETHNITSERIS